MGSGLKVMSASERDGTCLRENVPQVHQQHTEFGSAQLIRVRRSSPQARSRLPGVPGSALRFTGCRSRGSPTHCRMAYFSAAAATEAETCGGTLARYVVVFGGWDTDPVRRYNDVHVLDTVTWTWHAAAVAGDAPSARCGHSACAVQVDGGKHAVLVLHGQEEDERLCACAHLLMLE